MIVDLSKIPESCSWNLSFVMGKGFYECSLKENLQHRIMEVSQWDVDVQKAVDKAVKEFYK